ncbi:MAG: hypothetical protein IKN64_07010 [Desulfovibrio sp.]|nr:hypothetical protein [Desulfovibrio sp.]
MSDSPVSNWSEELLQRGGMRGRLEGFKSGYLKGFKSGFFQGRREVARNMLQEGKPVEEISDVTGLLPGDVQKIPQEES